MLYILNHPPQVAEFAKCVGKTIQMTINVRMKTVAWESNQKMWPHGGQAFQSSIQFVTDCVFKTSRLTGLRLVTAVAHCQNDLLTYCFQYFAFWMFFDSTNRVFCKILRGQYVSHVFFADCDIQKCTEKIFSLQSGIRLAVFLAAS